MASRFELAFTAIAAVLGVAIYWAPFTHVIGYCSAGIWAEIAQAVGLFAMGIAAGVLRSKRVVLAVRLGVFAGWMLDLNFTLTRPQTFHCSHQLLPLEAALIAAYVFATSGAGAFVGRRIGKSWGEERRPLARRIATAMAAVTLAATAISTNVLSFELEHNAARALARLQQLGEAQLRYAETHPREGFTCELSALDARIRSPHPYSFEGRPSQNIWAGGYRYRLTCVQETVPRTDFLLEATPYCAPDCGHIEYCVDHTGVVKELLHPRGNECERLGRPVAKLGERR